MEHLGLVEKADRVPEVQRHIQDRKKIDLTQKRELGFIQNIMRNLMIIDQDQNTVKHKYQFMGVLKNIKKKSEI